MASTEDTLDLGVGGKSFEYVVNGDLLTSGNYSEVFVSRSQQACTHIAIMGGDGEVGRLSWDDGHLAFSGDMAESAQIFFECLKPLVDDYIRRASGEAA